MRTLITQKINDYTAAKEELLRKNDYIAPLLYNEYGVKKGLRDEKGNGVLAGLTNISKVTSFKTVDRQKVPCDGELWYRGYRIEDLLKDLGHSYGYEKIAYLLITGEMPDKKTETEFFDILAQSRTLPSNFTRDVIMKAPSGDIMNSITKSILTLASYDEKVSDTSIPNTLRQCIGLIAQFPMLAVYAYHAHNYYNNGDSMLIHRPDPKLSTAENILMMLRPDKDYTSTEAKVLDTALILHMEHGGGNNSTFTTRVITSAGSDTYSTVAAAMSSLKGPKHGGANLKVCQMFEDLKANIQNWEDEKEIEEYLLKILDKQAFDRTGLIYGMGHAVYTLSDPRCVILKRYARRLAEEKGRLEEFEFMSKVENLAGVLVAQKRNVFKKICANVDFYSGFVYSMLDIPYELYTPLFAISRISGWCAHRMEELVNAGKIIRPAYKYVGTHKHYYELEDRFW